MISRYVAVVISIWTKWAASTIRLRLATHFEMINDCLESLLIIVDANMFSLLYANPGHIMHKA
eukprot:scaffold214262_cov43-Prasinocladus_malaysianus.AAC.1